MDKDSPNGLHNPAFEQLGPVPDTEVGSHFRITGLVQGEIELETKCILKSFQE